MTKYENMNLKIKIIPLSALAFFCLFACNSDPLVSTDSIGLPNDGLIRVVPQVEGQLTRAGWDKTNFASEGRQFGLFITPQTESPQPAFTYSNARIVYKNGIWSEYTPEDIGAITPVNRMYWYDSHFKTQVQAYLPYENSISSLGTITNKISPLQNEDAAGGSVSANDYLYFSGIVNPLLTNHVEDMNGHITEYALKEGKIAIPFRHVASKLNLKIKLATEFNVTSPGTATNPITDLKINGTICHFNFDLSTGAFSATGDASEPVSAWYDASSYVAGKDYSTKSLANYECILVPQTVSAGVFSISFTLNGKKHEWTSKTAVPLLSGKQHNLSLDVGENIIVLSDFTVTDWGVTDVPVSPDLYSSIEIDPAFTTLGEDVSLSLAEKRLHFTNQGGTALLAFTGEYDKNYEIVSDDPRLTIVPEAGTYKNSIFRITATQPGDRDRYSVRLLVSNPLLTTAKAIEVLIDVDTNMVPFVEMGGLVWMTFNGVGRETSLYKHNSKYSCREIYATDWNKFTGMYMWGPRPEGSPVLFPWTVSDATNPGTTIVNGDIPDWTSENTNIPCPEGWRLPTYDEYATIWPANGTAIPATYTRNNVQYTASIIDSGAPEIIVGTDTIVPRLFVISNGKDELLFPMNGWRMRKDYAGGKKTIAFEAGKSFYLWTQNHGPNGWNAKIVGVNSNSTSYYNTGDNKQAMAEAYESVRCIKNE